jgi:hypothetical protein
MEFEAVADQFQCRRHFHSPRLYHQPGLMLKVELEEYNFLLL